MAGVLLWWSGAGGLVWQHTSARAAASKRAAACCAKASASASKLGVARKRFTCNGNAVSAALVTRALAACDGPQGTASRSLLHKGGQERGWGTTGH